MYIDNGKEIEQIVPATDNKQRIYSYLENNPGSHLRKICKDLIIAMGDIQYQLKFLEKSVATIRVIQDVLYGAVL